MSFSIRSVRTNIPSPVVLKSKRENGKDRICSDSTTSAEQQHLSAFFELYKLQAHANGNKLQLQVRLLLGLRSTVQGARSGDAARASAPAGAREPAGPSRECLHPCK